ncbi:UDP-N-acetylglucosamine 2-epimerase (hydrolyzing) [Cyanobium sp. ATX 6E8]|uniref:UDP-N-acetylglucosamine 2-epimerase n=1 Tax=Cyanobium sp. ATX 6E8 TaxID=2823701 RepID=UPI0020CE2294|nr:UDP-N-acetylglucosamine 2-epimerase [Cyanobium sp. ATX 6E8]MCP9941914.1 UDP-N-acetylglucosamine 2-epimerase (hydrolyzing) [Cyanobium sp. ATX 6E8]
MAERRIAVFTGSRAEYGLLRHLIKAIDAEPGLALQLIVSGSHLSQRHGSTVAEIEADGTPIAARVPLSLDANPVPSMATLTAEALAGVGKALERLQPGLLILLGDRYEAFAAAAAAHLQGIAVVHLHGGETTEGAVDDRLRQAITQLSSWHFTAAEPYRQRVIAMGQPPERVFNVGPMVLDGLLAAPPASRSAFEQSTGFRFAERNLLITYHPETLLPDRGVAGFEALLEALERIPCHVLFTHPNADAGSEQLLQRLQAFVRRHPQRCWALPSLGQQRYLAALQLFEAMAGNSSSGVIEAPLLAMPVLNFGGRQAGRLRHGPVHDAPAEPEAIARGLEQVLQAGQRQHWPRPCPPPASAPAAAITAWLSSEHWR